MPFNNGVYRNVLDQIALNQLLVPPDIPNPNLGVEDGQADGPFNLAYIKYSPKQPTIVVPSPASIPIEQFGPSFTGNPVDPTLFPMDFIVGPPIGGI